jgi:hypothetical protein
LEFGEAGGDGVVAGDGEFGPEAVILEEIGFHKVEFYELGTYLA